MAQIDVSKFQPSMDDPQIGEDVKIPLSDGSTVTLYTFLNLRAQRQQQFVEIFKSMGNTATDAESALGSGEADQDKAMDALTAFSGSRADAENLITLVCESDEAAERVLDDPLYRPMMSLMKLVGEYMEGSLSGEQEASGQS